MELDYRRFFKGISKERIDYLVVGGLAVNLHGIPRMTYDIDLMILLDTENIIRLIRVLKRWGYSPRVPVQAEELADKKKRETWIREKNMKAFTFINDKEPLGEIDLIIDSPIPYNLLRERAVLFNIAGVEVPVISISDLIALKALSGRKQDLSDIEHLRTIIEKG
ncbi:conserved hypothetical protein [uncultured Desulfobacterium sp.]|uniref:Uncharacterized protein n=1 Tax=uncultured Desulfobacterium sp. TaxID=201089 RepID=A0A445MZU2_9BACT|nr:conserved hypothetical protein [uncultured Desulfobacterium sp.]